LLVLAYVDQLLQNKILCGRPHASPRPSSPRNCPLRMGGGWLVYGTLRREHQN
jgi:hypothetical protein